MIWFRSHNIIRCSTWFSSSLMTGFQSSSLGHISPYTVRHLTLSCCSEVNLRPWRRNSDHRDQCPVNKIMTMSRKGLWLWLNTTVMQKKCFVSGVFCVCVCMCVLFVCFFIVVVVVVLHLSGSGASHKMCIHALQLKSRLYRDKWKWNYPFWKIFAAGIVEVRVGHM